MRWPVAWQDPLLTDRVKGTAINCLVADNWETLGAVRERAQRLGIATFETSALPAGVTVVAGSWPGVKLNASGTTDWVSAGPTGNPWVDANTWRVRLAASLNPGQDIWVDAAPKDPMPSPDSHAVAVADAAVHGGRWVISLEDRFAGALANGTPESQAAFGKVVAAAGFFAARQDWLEYRPAGVLAVVSDFAGENEFLAHELLNLLARSNQQHLIVPRKQVAAGSFAGLKAVLFVDVQPPEPALRTQLIAFVERGGTLVTGPRWGGMLGVADPDGDHPRFYARRVGTGRVAVSRGDIDDPFLFAGDAAVLISHRHDLVRLWNGWSVGAYLSNRPDGKRALLQMVFYAASPSDAVSVFVAGAYRTAALWTPDLASARSVDHVLQKGGIELHVPPTSHYAAIELGP
jgi:hypothetical protein